MRRPALASGVIWLVAAAWCASAPPAAASQGREESLLGGVTVEQVLRHAALAPQIVDYEGTKILSVLRGDLMETVIVNEAQKRPGRTRLDFLSPEGVAGRLVIDDGTQTWHYEPRWHMVFLGPSLAAPADAATTFDPRRYHIRLLGVEEVIGRPTVVIRLLPRHGRRERRLWVDRTTGVTLRVEDRDPEEGLVVAAYFTRISFGLNLPAALFQPRVPAGARVVGQAVSPGPLLPVPVLERALGFPVRAPRALPGGFSLQGGAPVRDGPVMAASLRYSDGARWLVLFVAPAARMGPPGRGDRVPGLGPGGRTVVAGAIRLIQWESQGTRLALTGPLSLGELVALASAVTGRP